MASLGELSRISSNKDLAPFYSVKSLPNGDLVSRNRVSNLPEIVLEDIEQSRAKQLRDLGIGRKISKSI